MQEFPGRLSELQRVPLTQRRLLRSPAAQSASLHGSRAVLPRAPRGSRYEREERKLRKPQRSEKENFTAS